MTYHLHFLCLVSHHHLSWHPSLAPRQYLGQRLPVVLPLVPRQQPCWHVIHFSSRWLGWHQPPTAVRLTLAPHLQSEGRLTPAPSVAWLTPVLSAIQPTPAPPHYLHVETCPAPRLKSVIHLTPAPSAICPAHAPLIKSVVRFSSAPSAAPPSSCPCLQLTVRLQRDPQRFYSPSLASCLTPSHPLGTVMVCSLIISCFILIVSFPFVFSASCYFFPIFFVPRFSCLHSCINKSLSPCVYVSSLSKVCQPRTSNPHQKRGHLQFSLLKINSTFRQLQVSVSSVHAFKDNSWNYMLYYYYFFFISSYFPLHFN